MFANVPLPTVSVPLRQPRRLKLVPGKEKEGWLETQALGWRMEEAASRGLWPSISEGVTRPAVVCPSKEGERPLFAS